MHVQADGRSMDSRKRCVCRRSNFQDVMTPSPDTASPLVPTQVERFLQPVNTYDIFDIPYMNCQCPPKDLKLHTLFLSGIFCRK